MISLHANLNTLSQVYAAKPKKPRAAGARWRGVPHGVLLGTLIKELEVRNLSPYSDVRLVLSRGRQDLACSIPLSGMRSPKGIRPCVGFVASNAQRCGLCFYAGAVTGDDLPIVIADIDGNENRAWYYTEQFDVAAVVKEAVDKWHEWMHVLENAVLGLQMTTADDAVASKFYFDIGRYKIIPWSMITAIDAYWQRSESKSCWELYRAVGTISHQLPPMTAMQQMRRCYYLLSGK